MEPTDAEDDEIFPSEIIEKNKETLSMRLKSFSYHFVVNIEENLNFCLQILEERSLSKTKNSLATTAIGLLVSAIPKIGSGLSSAIKEGELFISERIDKNKSQNLADLVYFYSDNKDKIRRILIYSAIETFYSFECQFMKVSCSEGPLKAMHKLAIDAAYRVLDYLLEIQQKNITIKQITKGVIKGKSKRSNFGKRSGRTVKNTDATKWRTSSVYGKCGLFFGNELQFYKKKNSKREKYGYRRTFDWENPDNLVDDIIQVEEVSLISPDYILEKTDYNNLFNTIKEYIMTKIPEENAQLDRERKHNESMTDRKRKQKEFIEILEQIHNVQLQCLELNFKEIFQQHENNHKIVTKIDKKQDIELENQTNINTKLNEMHQERIITKKDMARLIKTTERIKREVREINDGTWRIDPESVKRAIKYGAEVIDPEQLRTLADNGTWIMESEPVKNLVNDVTNKLKDKDRIKWGVDRVCEKMNWK